MVLHLGRSRTIRTNFKVASESLMKYLSGKSDFVKREPAIQKQNPKPVGWADLKIDEYSVESL